MTSLHPLSTLGTMRNVNVELRHNRLNWRNVDQELFLDCVISRFPATGWTHGWQLGLQHTVDPFRPGSFGLAFGAPLEKGAACRLPARSASSNWPLIRANSTSSLATGSSSSAMRCRSISFSPRSRSFSAARPVFIIPTRYTERCVLSIASCRY